MDVHSTNFTFCALEPLWGAEDKVFGTLQVKPDYRNVINYINKLKKELGDGFDFVCGYEAGCLGYSLYSRLKAQGVNCVILAPTTMMEQFLTDTSGSRCLSSGSLEAGCLRANDQKRNLVIPHPFFRQIKDVHRLAAHHLRVLC